MKKNKLLSVAYTVLFEAESGDSAYAHFNEAGVNYNVYFTALPELYDTCSQASAMKLIAENKDAANDPNSLFFGSYSVVPIRIMPSSSTEDSRYSRLTDARTLYSGLLKYDDINKSVKKLAGKILTILDAAHTNENQNKAVKDLVKSSFRSQLSEIWNEAYRDDPNDGCGQTEDPRELDILD